MYGKPDQDSVCLLRTVRTRGRRVSISHLTEARKEA